MKSKTYSTISSAKRALRKAGLQSVPVEFEIKKGLLEREHIIPILQCQIDEEIMQVRRLGFRAVKVSSDEASGG